MKAFIAGIIGLCAFSVFGQFQWPKASVGMLEGITATVPVPNTNQLWVSGAGTTGFNGGPYTLMQGAPNLGVGSFAYTNIVGATTTNWIIAQFGGTSAGDGGLFEQKPFIMGTFTNNWSTSFAASGYAYFSSIAINGYWTNGDSITGAGAGTGSLPVPTVTYGTNLSTSSYLVYVNPNYFASQYANGCVYVATNGNDIMASNLQCAFLTCQAAKRFAPQGSTIYVEPGIYYDRDLLKNGVDWQFEKNSFIGLDISQVDQNTRGIFDDYAGAVTSTITGDRIHFTVAGPAVGYERMITNPASRVIISFNQNDIAAYTPYVSTTALFAGQNPSLPQTGSGGGAAGVFVNSAYVDVTDIQVNGYTNTIRQMLNGNDNGIGAGNTFGQYVPITNLDEGYSWVQGECHIHFHSATITNAPAGSPPSYLFVSGNTGSTESSCFIDGEFANGFMYWDDPNPLTRTWAHIRYLNGAPNIASGGGVPALRYYGNGVHYYYGEKVSAYNGQPVFDTGGQTFYFRLFANIQKITENGAGYWMNLSGQGFAQFTIMYFEDNSGNRMTGGIQISGSGTNNFFGGNIILSNAPAISVTGGQNFFEGMSINGLSISNNASPVVIDGGTNVFMSTYIQAHGTNYPIEYLSPNISTFTNTLTLQGMVLRNSSASCCIWSTNLLGTFVYGSSNSGTCDVAATNNVHFIGIGL